jgi:hypothetical protein
MNQFDQATVAVMRAALEEVCKHIPAGSTGARAFVATRILESAHSGDRSLDALMRAGRRAVIDRFGSTNAAMKALSDAASP